MPNRIESVKCMQRWRDRQVPGLRPAGPSWPARLDLVPRAGRSSLGRRRVGLGAHPSDSRGGGGDVIGSLELQTQLSWCCRILPTPNGEGTGEGW